MKSFAEFEHAFLSALQQERSELQGLQGESEAQLSGWIEHLFRQYLGYTHWKEITREGSSPIGAKGSKQLFPDLRIDVLDNGVIFVECKKLGRLDGPKGQDELSDAVNQLRSYIRAHVDQATIKPKTVLGVVTDGNHWLLMGLNRANEFHTIAEWVFLTDDPRLIALRLWLLAKQALAQPTSALVEFLARRTLAEVLKDNTKWLTKKVNEKLPDGNVSEELIGKWLRDAFSETIVPPRVVAVDSPSLPPPAPAQAPPPAGPGKAATEIHSGEETQSDRSEAARKAWETRRRGDAGAAPPQPPPVGSEPVGTQAESAGETSEPSGRRIAISDLIGVGLLQQQDLLMVEGAEGRRQTATITPDGKINVAGHLFDAVSPAALMAMELAGKSRKAVNGWTAFRVLRGGNQVGTLLELRSQYEDAEEGAPAEPPQGAGPSAPAALAATDPMVLAAVDQLKPLLGLLPDVVANTSKTGVSLYVGKAVIGYAYPRKRGLPRVRVYVGKTCPEWTTPDPTHAAWCYIDDWNTNIERVVALFKEAPRRRAEDMMAGRDPYRRREQPPGETAPLSPAPPP